MMARNQVMKRTQYTEMLMKSCNEGWISWRMALATKSIFWGINTLIGSYSSLASIDIPQIDGILISPESIDSLANELYV